MRDAREKLMTAGRADCIPKGSAGLWVVRKIKVTTPGIFPDGENCPPGSYTALTRYTDASLAAENPYGETVMADNPIELRKHLGFAMRARGRVLITGLGLGCVLRMVQANPRVEHVTVIEISQDVIDLVWPHTPHDRCRLVQADAAKYLKQTKRCWDCAWHDIWTDTGAGEEHLAVAHQRMMIDLVHRVDFQGAWAFPGEHKREFNRVVRNLRARKAVLA